MTRNQWVEQSTRGFESPPLRQPNTSPANLCGAFVFSGQVNFTALRYPGLFCSTISLAKASKSMGGKPHGFESPSPPECSETHCRQRVRRDRKKPGARPGWFGREQPVRDTTCLEFSRFPVASGSGPTLVGRSGESKTIGGIQAHRLAGKRRAECIRVEQAGIPAATRSQVTTGFNIPLLTRLAGVRHPVQTG